MSHPVDPKVSSTSPSTDSDPSPSRLARHLRRKITKHVVERKRRDRINHSMDQLRSLVLEALNKNPEQYSKMEKADVLDMTVQYLKVMRTRSRHHGASQPYDTANYSNGYRACAAEVARHLASTTIPDNMKTSLMSSITQQTTNPLPVTHASHVIGYHADHTATPPGWRGVPPPAYPHTLPLVHSPQYGSSLGTTFRVPATQTTSAQPRDLNMNIVGMQSAYQGMTSPVDNARFHPQRRVASESAASTTSTSTSDSSRCAQPLQLNLSLNFGSQRSTEGRSTNAGEAYQEADDMWRPW